MFNIIIFLIGAGIMFYMAWRSWSRRRKLMTKGEKVEAAVAGTVQSRDGEAYLLEFTTAGGTHCLHYPKSAKGRELAQGAVVTLYYNPDDPAEMYVEGDKSVLGAEVLYVVLGIVLLVLMAGIARREGEKKMKLEHFGMAEPGDCRVVFSAAAEELEAAVQAEKTVLDAPQDEDDLLTAAVNRAILEGFSPLFAQLMKENNLQPVTDPDFELLAVNRAEGFRAGAQFFCLPPLELGEYTGFTQPIQPRPIRELTIELEINRRHGDEDRAADAEGKRALRAKVMQDIYAQRCQQARAVAEQALIAQLGTHVTGPLPKQLVAGNYFAEQRQFNLRMQANGVNFDQYLKVQGQTVEEFRAWLHAEAERKLRSRMGLLLVAQKEELWPTEAEVDDELAHWDAKRDGEHTFASNDRRRAAQRIASSRAAAFILAHSTLTPPPAEATVLKAENR